MTEIYYRVYECRFCKKQLKDGTWTEGEIIIADDIYTHKCNDFKIGICDLVGLEYKETME